MDYPELKRKLKDAVTSTINARGFTHEAEAALVEEVKRVVRSETMVVVEIDHPQGGDEPLRRVSGRFYLQWREDEDVPF